MALAVGTLASAWSVWGARPAQAIIVDNLKTGMFTLARGEAARVHVVNTAEDRGGITPCVGVFDSDGNMLAEFRGRALALGRAQSFVFIPPIDPDRPMAIRVELTVEGGRGTGKGINFIPTLEVFDTGTGRTSVGQDFIIDDGK